MNSKLSKFFEKFYFKKWEIGVCHYDIKDVIRNRSFDPDIKWIIRKSMDRFSADPFPLGTKNGNLTILFEEFKFDEDYGKISFMTLDKNLSPIKYKTLLDTKSHLSYPFFFTEENRTYVFPEAAQSGKLTCYEYFPESESIVLLKDIIKLPLLDSTILKYQKKYWIFGALRENNLNYKLSIFYSESLLGTYKAHACNGANLGLDGIRPAGNFIEVDGIMYRPTQNCKKNYGDSITINKVTELNETNYKEEPYMTISIDNKDGSNPGIHSIHTINSLDNYIVVDGRHWTFAPIQQIKKLYKNKS
jgi:hypothetical protein